MKRSPSYRMLVYLISYFIVASVLGLLAFSRLLAFSGGLKAQSNFVLSLFFSGYDIHYSVLSILIYVFIIALFALILSRFVRKFPFILRFLWVLFVFMGTVVLGLAVHPVVALPLGILIFLPYLVQPTVTRHNLILAIASAGYAILFALALSPWQSILLLLLVATSDALMVYGLKATQKIMSVMIREGVVLGMLLPYGKVSLYTSIDAVSFGSRFAFMGMGDYLLPLVVALTFFKISLHASFIVSLGAMVGMGCALYLSMNNTKPRPVAALPLVSAGILLSYFIFTILI